MSRPDNDERRPGRGSGGHVEAGQADTASVQLTADRDPVRHALSGRYMHTDEVREWLHVVTRRLVLAGTELPVFGSDEWLGAPDPVRLASALRAAEAWRLDGLYAAQDVADSLSAARWVQQCEDAAGWAEIGAQVRQMASSPTHAELLRRRAEIVRPALGGAL